MPKTSSYRAALLESLRDPEEAQAYLNAAMGDSKEALLKALKNIAQANSMAKVAREAGVQRETLYRSFSESGNPTWDTFLGVLNAVGLKVIFAAIEERSETPSPPPSMPPIRTWSNEHVDDGRIPYGTNLPPETSSSPYSGLGSQNNVLEPQVLCS
jgi:probable addiction module antidote protein